MSGRKASAMANWWQDLTAPRAADADEARREYRTRVLLVLQAVALSVVSLPVILGWNAGMLRPAAVGMVLFADLWAGAALWLAHRGRWRVGGIVSPALFVVLGLYNSYSWGLETPGVLSYAVAIVVAGMLHGNWGQWIVVGLSFSAHLIAGWLYDPVSAGELVRVAVVAGSAFVGIALLQSFATRQLESAIGEAHAHAGRLAERTAELVQANAALSNEIAERRKAGLQRDAAMEELRETRDFLESLIGNANAPIMVWDPEFRITRFNRAFEHLTGRSAADVLGAGIDMLFPTGRREEALAHTCRAMVGERWETVEIPILHLDGSVRTVLWDSAILYAADGVTPVATIAQGADITERIRAQEEIKTSLREKEVLLREVHHRVKNNLQVVSSLLRMQARAIQNEQAVQALRECEGRVWSMACIHDHLHRSKSVAAIDMEQYVKELAGSLIGLYGASAIEVAVDAPGVKLALDKAIPCGLILNELVTNCL